MRRTRRHLGQLEQQRVVHGADGRKRIRCSPRRAERAGVSMATTRPASITATRSHSRSASSMKWVTSRTVTPRVADALDQRPGLAPGLRVQAGGQLVEDRQPRAADERERDRQALLLAAGELAERRVARLPEPELLDQPSGSAGVAVEEA